MTCPHDWIPPQSCPLCKDAEIERLTKERDRLLAALKAIADDPDTNIEAAVYARNTIAYE